MFEHRSQPLLPRRRYYLRLLKGLWYGLILIGISLLIGIIGYHHFEGLGWVDSLLEASMILGGMGPVAPLHSDGAKIFASCYALYSGLMLIGVMGILLTPVVHRIMHSVHMEDK